MATDGSLNILNDIAPACECYVKIEQLAGNCTVFFFATSEKNRPQITLQHRPLCCIFRCFIEKRYRQQIIEPFK
jgi:hypothetical protein